MDAVSDIVSQRCDGMDIRIVVIDNGSTNGIASEIRTLYPYVTVIMNSTNLGFSGGNNIAVDMAIERGVDFLFVLNDDIRVSPNYVLEMVQEGLKLSDAAALGSTIRLPNGKIQAVCGHLKPRHAGVVWSSKKISETNSNIREIDAIQGAAIVLTKLALKKGFKFDRSLHYGAEEYDLACWSKSVSLKNYVLEHVEVIHNTNQMNQILNRWYPASTVNYYAIRNNIYIKRKYAISKLEYSYAVICLAVRVVIKGFLFMCKGDIRTVTMMLKGISDGLNGKMGEMSGSPKLDG